MISTDPCPSSHIQDPSTHVALPEETIPIALINVGQPAYLLIAREGMLWRITDSNDANLTMAQTLDMVHSDFRRVFSHCASQRGYLYDWFDLTFGEGSKI